MEKDSKRPAEVIMYTAAGCGYCAQAKALFKEARVNFEEREISNEKFRDEVIEKIGQALTPVTIIAGQTIIGFDKPKLEAAIQQIKN